MWDTLLILIIHQRSTDQKHKTANSITICVLTTNEGNTCLMSTHLKHKKCGVNSKTEQRTDAHGCF